MAVYLACPGNVAYFGRNVGRLEMYSLIFFLIGILLFEKIKNDYTRYLAIFLCTEAALAVHQGTIFYYFPLVVTVLMYELCTKFSLKTLLFTVLNFAGEFATFIYFQLFSGLRYDTLETTMHVIAGRTDMEIDTQAVRLEYFASLKENFDYGQGYFLKNYNYEKMVFLALVLLSPVLLFIISMFAAYMKERKIIVQDAQITVFKEPIMYVLLSYLLYLPIYILMCDWGRWTGALIGTSFFHIGYLYAKNDEIMLKVFSKLEIWVEHNKFLAIIILLYLAGLEKFSAVFSKMLYNVYSMLFG